MGAGVQRTGGMLSTTGPAGAAQGGFRTRFRAPASVHVSDAVRSVRLLIQNWSCINTTVHEPGIENASAYAYDLKVDIDRAIFIVHKINLEYIQRVRWA